MDGRDRSAQAHAETAARAVEAPKPVGSHYLVLARSKVQNAEWYVLGAWVLGACVMGAAALRGRGRSRGC